MSKKRSALTDKSGKKENEELADPITYLLRLDSKLIRNIKII